MLGGVRLETCKLDSEAKLFKPFRRIIGASQPRKLFAATTALCPVNRTFEKTARIYSMRLIARIT